MTPLFRRARRFLKQFHSKRESEPEIETEQTELRTLSLWDRDVDQKVEALKAEGFAVVDLHVLEADSFWQERILVLRRPLMIGKRRHR